MTSVPPLLAARGCTLSFYCLQLQVDHSSLPFQSWVTASVTSLIGHSKIFIQLTASLWPFKSSFSKNCVGRPCSPGVLCPRWAKRSVCLHTSQPLLSSTALGIAALTILLLAALMAAAHSDVCFVLFSSVLGILPGILNMPDKNSPSEIHLTSQGL